MTQFPRNFLASAAFRNESLTQGRPGQSQGSSSLWAGRGALVVEETEASTEWTISHEFSHPPVVQVFEDGVLITAEVQHYTGSTVIRFAVAVAGVAVLIGSPDPDALDFIEFEQSEPSAEWIVDHSFEYPPIVAVLDENKSEVEAEVEHTATTEVTIRFSSPSSGRAILV